MMKKKYQTGTTTENERQLIDMLCQLAPNIHVAKHHDIEVTFNALHSYHHAVLHRLFNYFLHDQYHYMIKVVIKNKKTHEINRDTFKRDMILKDDFSNQERNFFLSNTVLLAALLSSLKTNHIPFPTKSWCLYLEKNLSAKIAWPQSSLDIDLKDTTMSMNDLYHHNTEPHDPVLIKTMAKLMILHLYDHQILDLFQSDVYLNIIKTTDQTLHFRHHAMRANFREGLEWLVNILGDEYDMHNDNHQTYLHVCKNDETLLSYALKQTKDINDPDESGNTALHHAAQEKDIKKARFLLRSGADPNQINIANQTFWTKISFGTSDPSLDNYRAYYHSGHVLSCLPMFVQQYGPNCGIIATYISAEHTRFHWPGLFTKPLPLPKKCHSNPKATISLRQIAKKLNITQFGSIFSVFGIKKLLKETECESLICPIQSYDQFMNTIKVAIQNNLPIIIPYNNIINHNSNKMSGENLHWATIIGIIDTSTLQSILLASHNC